MGTKIWVLYIRDAYILKGEMSSIPLPEPFSNPGGDSLSQTLILISSDSE